MLSLSQPSDPVWWDGWAVALYHSEWLFVVRNLESRARVESWLQFLETSRSQHFQMSFTFGFFPGQNQQQTFQKRGDNMKHGKKPGNRLSNSSDLSQAPNIAPSAAPRSLRSLTWPLGCPGMTVETNRKRRPRFSKEFRIYILFMRYIYVYLCISGRANLTWLWEWQQNLFYVEKKNSKNGWFVDDLANWQWAHPFKIWLHQPLSKYAGANQVEGHSLEHLILIYFDSLLSSWNALLGVSWRVSILLLDRSAQVCCKLLAHASQICKQRSEPCCTRIQHHGVRSDAETPLRLNSIL